MSSLHDNMNVQQEPDHPQPYYTRPTGPHWFTMIGVWAVVFLLVWWLFRPAHSAPLYNPDAEPIPVTPRGDLSADEQATVEIFHQTSPSVVYITSTELRRGFFSFDVFEVPSGSGSGLIYDRDGHIVTNYHVIHPVRRDRRWTVTLSDQSQWPARFVGEAADKDLAVLKIDVPPERLKPITFGSSHDLQVGQKVLAIGNPFGFDQTLTIGVVSALGREIQAMTGRTIHDVIQTDAAINPGNSGGPLLDSAGRMIGVNTQIASPTGANAGIGFAVPVDIVNRIVPQIIKYGRVIRPVLGVLTWSDWKIRRIGIKTGVMVREVAPGSAAEKSGLRGTILTRDGYARELGDIIIKIDDYPVTDQNSLLDALERYEVGDEVQVTYLRNEKIRTASVQLQSL